MDKNIELLVLAYLESRPGSDERHRLEAALIKAGYDMKEFESLESVNENLDKLDVPEPSERLDTRFYDMLAMQEHKDERFLNWFLGFRAFLDFSPRVFAVAVYSLVLLMTGWFLGGRFTPQTDYEHRLNTMQTEMSDMKQLVTLTLIQHPSAVQRLQGVSRVSDLDTLGVAIVHALLMTLNSDPNMDVRLMAVQSLARFSEYPMVREGLVHAINVQKDSQVLLMLADIMVSCHEKESIYSFEQLLANRDLDQNVRDKIEKSILTLL